MEYLEFWIKLVNLWPIWTLQVVREKTNQINLVKNRESPQRPVTYTIFMNLCTYIIYALVVVWFSGTGPDGDPFSSIVDSADNKDSYIEEEAKISPHSHLTINQINMKVSI